MLKPDRPTVRKRKGPPVGPTADQPAETVQPVEQKCPRGHFLPIYQVVRRVRF